MTTVASRGGNAVSAVLLPALALGLTLVFGIASVSSVEPGEVAVRVNNLARTQETVTQPGFLLRVPLLHTVHLLHAAPQTFNMKGEKNQGPLDVRALTVRASDGSNFHFDEFTLIFQLKGDESVQAIADAGSGDAYLRWMKPYARSILRDAFGRESTIDVSDPSNYHQAGQRAKARLNELLGPHAIMVTQVVTPRPSFTPEYEAAIEQRNALGNQVDVIRSDLARAETERNRRLAEVDQIQNKRIQEKRAEMESTLATSIARQAETKREADTYRISKLGEGQARLSSATARARELAGQLDAQYVARSAEIGAFRNQPVERVMERIGERLKGVTVEIQPYADDATPTRIKLDQ
ncbi:MAG: SPFH domain-containing protein [Nannocystaceae bacterium]